MSVHGLTPTVENIKSQWHFTLQRYYRKKVSRKKPRVLFCVFLFKVQQFNIKFIDLRDDLLSIPVPRTGERNLLSTVG
jgi:hypothetical protein